MSDRLYLQQSVRRIENQAAAGLPPTTLMRRAGEAAADWAHRLLGGKPGRVVAMMGPGNNGGDAAIAASALHAMGHTVDLLVGDDGSHLPDDARRAREALPAALRRYSSVDGLAPPDLILDGVFGIGLTRPIQAPYDAWIAWANAIPCIRLALDIPSGLHADSGRLLGTAVFRATHTLTFLMFKPGAFTADGPDVCGTLQLATLGVQAALPADGELITSDNLAEGWRALHRPANSHKGRFGSAMIIGGAAGMTGAAWLAGRAALKTGAGRVFVGLVDPGQAGIDPLHPEIMVREASGLVRDGRVSALALGPGMGTSAHARDVWLAALQSDAPAVLDADALNLLSMQAEGFLLVRQRRAPTVLTPHPLEAARLLNTTVEDIQSDRLSHAQRLAQLARSVVMLKGQGTIVAGPAGEWAINPTGNPGLASAGSGDVLTGMLAALLAQSLDAWTAARLAAWLHGAAADRLVRQGIGPVGLTAGELPDAARAILNEQIRQTTKAQQ